MWIWLAILVVGIIIFAAFCLFQIHRTVSAAATGKLYTLDQEIPARQVAVVLGARVYANGRLSPMLADRVDAGIDLYKRGVVKKLLMSGDNREAKYNEVSAMRNYAIAHGVPSDDVVRDFAGFRTYDSIYRAKELWDLDEMIIVSQEFHLSRALYIAGKLHIDAIGVAARHKDYSSLKNAQARERLARILAWIDVIVGRDPYFLGPKESLSGDAQKPRVPE